MTEFRVRQLVSDAVRDAQNEVFSAQLYHLGLLAAAFHRKHGSVRVTFREVSKRVCVHEPEPSDPQEPVDPHVWKQRADEYFRVCDIPPDECVVVTHYSSEGDGNASVGFSRRSWVEVVR